MTEINISKIKIDEIELNIKDSEARNNITSLSTDIISLSTDIISLSTDIISLSTDIISLSTELELKADFAKEILFFGTTTNNAMTINTGTNCIIGTIINSLITSDMVLLNCTFANPSYITSNIQWQTNNGSFTLSGNCSAATSANITLGLKGN